MVIPVRDELERMPHLLACIEAQSLPPDEVVVADGRSSDGTRAWLEGALAGRPWLSVVDNPQRTVPAGLNQALRVATGELVARMDAHADYHPDYLAQLVRVLVADPEVVVAGGAMDTRGRGPWGHSIAAVLRRRVGLGGARHRIGGAGGPVEHVFTGCYRRRAVLHVGGYDERLLANEDFELDTRLRHRGGLVWLEPRATCTWYVRETIPALARQMWRYGYYKAGTLRLHPTSVKARQLLPPGLILGLLGLTLTRRRWGVVASCLYVGAAAAAGAHAARSDGAAAWRGALVPVVVHICWGSGLLAGIVVPPVRGPVCARSA